MYICLFGKPEAYEVSILGPDGPDERLERVFTDLVALPEALSLAPGEEMVRVSRHLVGDHVLTWIGLYRHAYAIGSTRPGGFYGVAFLVEDESIAGAAAYDLLRTYANTMRDTFLDPANPDGAFVRKPFVEARDVDFAAIALRLAGRGPVSSGLDPAALRDAFIDLSDDKDRFRFGEFITLTQTDPRFSGERAAFLSESSRVAAAAAAARSTTRIISHRPDAVIARQVSMEKTTPAAPTAAPAPTAPLTLFAGDRDRDSAKLPLDVICAQVSDELRAILPAHLDQMLPDALHQHLRRLERRNRLHDAAITLGLLLLFALGILLAIDLIPRREPVRDDPTRATLADASAVPEPGADIAAINTLFADYAAAVQADDGQGAASHWRDTPREAGRATAMRSFSGYSVTPDRIIMTDDDRARATLHIVGATSDAQSFDTTATADLARDVADTRWKIVSMKFADATRADPFRAETQPASR